MAAPATPSTKPAAITDLQTGRRSTTRTAALDRLERAVKVRPGDDQWETLAAAAAALAQAGRIESARRTVTRTVGRVCGFPAVLLANDADTLGGTLRYLSPEVLSGLPAEEADDVWSLCVVLARDGGGRAPGRRRRHRRGGGTDFRRQRLGRNVWPAAATESSAVVAFTAAMLTASRAARTATARAYGDALSGILPSSTRVAILRPARSVRASQTSRKKPAGVVRHRQVSTTGSDNGMDDALPMVGMTLRFLALCDLYGSHQAAVGRVAEGRRAGVPGLPGDDDWTQWNAAQMRAAVEHLGSRRDAAPRAERPG